MPTGRSEKNASTATVNAESQPVTECSGSEKEIVKDGKKPTFLKKAAKTAKKVKDKLNPRNAAKFMSDSCKADTDGPGGIAIEEIDGASRTKDEAATYQAKFAPQEMKNKDETIESLKENIDELKAATEGQDRALMAIAKDTSQLEELRKKFEKEIATREEEMQHISTGYKQARATREKQWEEEKQTMLDVMQEDKKFTLAMVATMQEEKKSMLAAMQEEKKFTSASLAAIQEDNKSMLAKVQEEQKSTLATLARMQEEKKSMFDAMLEENESMSATYRETKSNLEKEREHAKQTQIERDEARQQIEKLQENTWSKCLVCKAVCGCRKIRDRRHRSREDTPLPIQATNQPIDTSDDDEDGTE